MAASTSIAKAKARLLADPALINVKGAAIRIISARHKCSEALAEMRLHEFKDSADIDGTYRKVLPEVHAKERGNIFDRRVNFFKEIDKRFPVDWEYLDEEYMNFGDNGMEGLSFFDLGIMIRSMRPFHAWKYREDWQDLPLAYKLADMLFDSYGPHAQPSDGVKNWSYFSKAYELPEDLKPVLERGAATQTLMKMFESHPSPLRFIPQAVRMLSYNTGCVFFDWDEEDGMESFEWSRQTVEWLSEQGAAARRIKSEIKRLDAWLLSDAAARVAKACRLFKKFQRKLSDGENILRALDGDASAGRALVAIF